MDRRIGQPFQEAHVLREEYAHFRALGWTEGEIGPRLGYGRIESFRHALGKAGIEPQPAATEEVA